MTTQDHYNDAMADFTVGDYSTAIQKLKAVLASEPEWFDAQLALSMAYSRLGDWPNAIATGHKAELLRPDDPMVFTNLSMFYMKAGDKAKAEHYRAKAKIESWKVTLAEGDKKNDAVQKKPGV
jgi:Flp pilus assembly protein TadD